MTLALEDASLAVGRATLLQPTRHRFEAGRVTAILGPNGAGKSSLLALASGARTPSRGRVTLGGAPLASFRAEPLARRRAMVSQHTEVLFDFSVREVVELGRHPHRLRPSRDEAGIVTQALEAADVAHLANRVYHTLSGGERARVQLARAMAQTWAPVEPGARWLLLDEPTAALDLAHQHAVMARARALAHGAGPAEQVAGPAGQGAAFGVIAVLHDLNLALRYADDVLVLAGGALVAAGPAREVLAPALIAQVWNVRSRAHDTGDGVPQYLFEPKVPARHLG